MTYHVFKIYNFFALKLYNWSTRFEELCDQVLSLLESAVVLFEMI